MINRFTIWSLWACLYMLPFASRCQSNGDLQTLPFFGDTLHFSCNTNISIPLPQIVSEQAIQDFYIKAETSNCQPLIDTLLMFRQRHALSDWLYYQLIRKAAGQLAPKADNYQRYTLYKWFLLCKSGFDATLGIGKNELLLYIFSQDSIYDIPYYIRNSRQYVCLNIHDYSKLDISNDNLKEVALTVPGATKPFSYTVTKLPDFNSDEYTEKDIEFSYQDTTYRFSIKLNPDVKNLFVNYPVVDFSSYFNIPMSDETYSSLIPLLKKNMEGRTVKDGVDYLMCFTRYAFLYENDQQHFGKEKHMSPEETLLYDHSDCDDRAALFFYLVKEIYNLPMIAVLYPTHITLAVQFEKPVGKTLKYNGNRYSICDPTSQDKNLGIGGVSPDLANKKFRIVYAYTPKKK